LQLRSRRCSAGPVLQGKTAKAWKRSGWSGTPGTVSTPWQGEQTPKEARNLMRVTGLAVFQRWGMAVKVPGSGQTLEKG